MEKETKVMRYVAQPGAHPSLPTAAEPEERLAR
jgi:hypothetical protein